jgi:hypothetical protein
MDSGKLLNEKQKIITGILLEEVNDKDLRKAERKLKTTEYDFEDLGMVCKMEYIDKIYRKLQGIFSNEDLWFYLYKLKWVSTLRIYEKMEKINRYLNGGKKKIKI